MHSVAKLQKTQMGDPLGTVKNFRKKSHSAEKNSKGGTLVTSTSQHQIFDEKFDQKPESVRIKMADLAGR